MRMNFANRGLVGSIIGLAFLAVIVAMMPPRDGMPTTDEHGLPDEIDSSDTKLPATDNFTEVKFQVRALYAVCSQRPDRNALGGFGPSDNRPKRVAKPLADSLYLLAEPEVAMPLAKGAGMRLLVVNGSKKEVAFAASDSLLSIVQQAQDESGAWRDIEYMPSSWCGNSYHTVYLSPGHGWQLTAYRYQGPQPAMLRFALTQSDGTKIYSNAFEGSIHPEQLTVKQGHQAQNIMDPYLD